MKWYGPWLFLLFLALSSYIIGGAVAGYVLWHQRRQNGGSGIITRLACVMWGLAFMGTMHIAANAFGYTVRPQYTIGFAWSYWIGTGALCVVLWWFVLYMVTGKK